MGAINPGILPNVFEIDFPIATYGGQISFRFAFEPGIWKPRRVWVIIDITTTVTVNDFFITWLSHHLVTKIVLYFRLTNVTTNEKIEKTHDRRDNWSTEIQSLSDHFPFVTFIWFQKWYDWARERIEVMEQDISFETVSLLWKKSEMLAPKTIRIMVHVCGNDARAPTSLILKP